jgi:hypothetical protein
VLQDLRFGVRMTDREARSTDTGYNWAAVTQPWMAWWYLAPGSLAYLNDPRFNADTHTHSFNNFFGGKSATPPSLVFPDVSLVNGYPDSYSKLHSYEKLLCTEFHNGDSSSCFNFWNPRDINDPQYHNDQRERTQGRLRPAAFSTSPTSAWTAPPACAWCAPRPRRRGTRCSRAPCPTSRPGPMWWAASPTSPASTRPRTTSRPTPICCPA